MNLKLFLDIVFLIQTQAIIIILKMLLYLYNVSHYYSLKMLLMRDWFPEWWSKDLGDPILPLKH